MKVELYIAKGCTTCEKVEKSLMKILIRFPSVQFLLHDIEHFNEHNISIVPALVVDNKLYSYGEFDGVKLSELIKQYS